MRRIVFTLSALVAVALVAGMAARSFAAGYQFTSVSTVTSPAVVLDSTGLEVGPLINTGGADSALSKDAGLNFALQVNTTGFVATGVFFSYTTADCSGTRYLISPPSNSLYISYPKTDNGTTFLSYYNGGVANGVLYYPTPKTSAKTTINSESELNPDGSSAGCFVLFSISASLSKVSTFDLTTLPFTPPFKVSW